tara:strand:+ start:190 stop:483 length:294 start_codon:yes stop_codon:yes gene_type:complete
MFKIHKNCKIRKIKEKQMNILDDILDDENISKKFKKAFDANDELKNNHNTIEMPIYYWEDEETKEKHYDFEEMANALEDRICKHLNKNVLITLSEVE